MIVEKWIHESISWSSVQNVMISGKVCLNGRRMWVKLGFYLLTFDIIFGIPNESGENIITSFNDILLCENYYIYKNKKKGVTLDTYKLILECKKRLIIDTKIMNENNIKRVSDET